MSSSVKIADGQNNAGGLTSLDLLSPPLFRFYIAPEGVLTEWHNFVTRELDGNRQLVEIGLPWVAWVFFKLSRAELSYLRSAFGDPVTIRTLDKQTNAYHNYNAIMYFPDLVDQAKWDTGEWLDVRVEFHDLEEL